MAKFNLVVEGYIAKDPEVRFSTAGNPMVQFSIACNQGKKEDNKPPIWFNFKAVGAAGKALEQAAKGNEVIIKNSMPEEWTDKNGNKRQTWVVFDAEIKDSTPF